MKSVSDIAQNKQKAEEARKKAEAEQKEATRKKFVPISALIFANIVFLSLDVRGFDAVNKVTNSVLLATLTILVSGVAALYWWDFAYPHARRHKNTNQERIALLGTGLGIVVSGVLAFLDYVVEAGDQNINWIWALIIFLTIVQGFMLAFYWKIDASIEAEAKREESTAARLDLKDITADFIAEIDSMETMLVKLEEIKKRFPRPGQAEIAARAMGYPVLAEMLADDDGDGVENYRDRDYKKPVNQSNMRPAFAQTAKDNLDSVDFTEGQNQK